MRHLNVQIDQREHEALARWSSRSMQPASGLVRELLVERLKQLGLLDTPNNNDVVR